MCTRQKKSLLSVSLNFSGGDKQINVWYLIEINAQEKKIKWAKGIGSVGGYFLRKHYYGRPLGRGAKSRDPEEWKE